MRPGGVTCGCPCDLEVDLAGDVGRLLCVAVGALDRMAVGVGLGDPLVVGGVESEVGLDDVPVAPAIRYGQGSVEDSAGASTVDGSVGSALRTGRSLPGGRPGLLSPGNATPAIRLSATAPRLATRTTVAPRSSSGMFVVRCPCGSAKT